MFLCLSAISRLFSALISTRFLEKDFKIKMQCIQALIILHCHLETVQPGVNCRRFIFCDIDCVPVCLSGLQIPAQIGGGGWTALGGGRGQGSEETVPLSLSLGPAPDFPCWAGGCSDPSKMGLDTRLDRADHAMSYLEINLSHCLQSQGL